MMMETNENTLSDVNVLYFFLDRKVQTKARRITQSYDINGGT